MKDNRKSILIIICIFVLFIVTILICTGIWMPFKTSEEMEAIKAYKEAYTVPEILWKEIHPEYEQMDKNSYAYKEIQEEFGQDGRLPYGFKIISDNGKKGDKEGVLKSMVSANKAYYEKYGLQYTVYYMKDEDYAKEKYSKLKNKSPGLKDFREEYSFSNGKIKINQLESTRSTDMIVKIGTVVYYFEGYAVYWTKMQPLFDKLNIDFIIPNLMNLYN